MWYKYVACNPRGQTATGVLEAGSERDAEKILWRSELTIVNLAKQHKPITVQDLLPTLYKVKTREVIYFTRDLATLLNSGIGILPALKMLQGRSLGKTLKRILGDVRKSVESGNSFSKACSQHTDAFSAFFIRMAKVGEEVGNLEFMLRQVATQMEKDAEIKKKVKGAMMYPSFVLIVAAFAIFALLYFVIPAMDVLFTQIGGNLPTITVVVLTAANFLQNNILWIALGLVALIALSAYYRKTVSGKKLLGKVVLKLPIIGQVVLLSTMTQLARNISIMVRGGINLSESLELLVQTTGNYPMKQALKKVRRRIHSGDPLSVAISKQPIFPPLFGQVAAVGEASGRLETNLEVLADFYETENDRAVSRATNLLSPILVAICGGIVGLVALAIYTPIYSLMGQIS